VKSPFPKNGIITPDGTLGGLLLLRRRAYETKRQADAQITAACRTVLKDVTPLSILSDDQTVGRAFLVDISMRYCLFKVRSLSGRSMLRNNEISKIMRPDRHEFTPGGIGRPSLPSIYDYTFLADDYLKFFASVRCSLVEF